MTATISQAASATASVPPSTTFALIEGEPLGQGVVRIALEQLDTASWHLRRIREADEHVHEVRKATKRVRAIFRMVRDDLGRETYSELNGTVRDVARDLSHARSAVVQIGVLEEIVDGNADLSTNAEPLRDELHLEAEATRASLDASLVADLAGRIDGVRDRIETLTTLPDGSGMRSGVRRTYAKGRKAMHRAYTDTSPEDFHIWRKQVKYLRHQMEIVSVIGPDIAADLIADLEEMGDALGAHNDLADLARTASAGESWPGRTELLGVIASERATLEQDLRSQAGTVYGERPDVFADRIARAWA